MIVIAIQPGDCQWRMQPALSPPQTARSKVSGSGNSSWYCEHLAMAVCKPFQPPYTHWRLHYQIKTWLISSITLPPPSPLPHNEGTINNHRRHHLNATALPNALLQLLKSCYRQGIASAAKLTATAMVPLPPLLPPRCQLHATTANKMIKKCNTID